MTLETGLVSVLQRIAGEFKAVRAEINSAGPGGGSPSAGSINVADYGAVGNWNRATQTGTDNTLALQAAFKAAHDEGKRIFFPGAGPIHTTGEFFGYVDVTDYDVEGDHNSLGFIAQPKGKSALRIARTFNPERTVTALRHIFLPSTDTDAPDDEHLVIDIARADLLADDPQRGDSFWMFSNTYFKNPANDTAHGGTGLGAVEFNGEAGRKTYMAQWVDVLGVGVEITDAAGSGGVREAQLVTGAISGATATVSSSAISAGGPRIAILTDIIPGTGTGKGYFQAGENLTTNDTGTVVVRGNITTGKEPFIVCEERLRFPMTESIRIKRPTRRNMRVDLTGIRIVASDNTDDYSIVGASRQAAIDLWGITNGKGAPFIKSSFKSGLTNNGGHRNKFIVTALLLPAYGPDGPSAWGYAVVDNGASSDNDYQIFGHGGRHGYTTNTRPTVGTTTDYEYLHTKGVAHGNVVHDSNLSGYLDAPLDTHPGSVDITFRNNTLSGQGSGGRLTSRSALIQLRGFGHKVFGNHIRNGVNGIRLVGMQFPAPFDTRDLIFDNVFENITGRIYDFTPSSKGSETHGKQSVVVKRGHGEMITRTNNPNTTDGIVMTFGRLRLVDFDLVGHAGAAGRFGALDELIIEGGQIDFTRSPAGARNFLLDTAVIPYLAFDGMKFVGGTNGIGTSIFRVLNGQTIRASTWSAHSAAGFTLPLWTSAAGTATVIPVIQGSIPQSNIAGLTDALAAKAPMPIVLAAGAPVPTGSYPQGQMFVEVV